jgi:periplasmic protein TonB
MTNKEILHADLLDILFENRNKAYGAYALRKNYHHRLQWALGISLALAFLLSIMNMAERKPGKKNISIVPDIILRTIDPPDPKKADPPKPKVEQPRKEVAYTAKIEIVPNDKKTEMPDLKDILTADISDKTIDGTPSSDTVQSNQRSEVNGTGDQQKVDHKDDFHPTNSDAQFPGGKEAFAKFLKKYLNTPGELADGEKKVVLVRFMVDADGTISKTEIVQSDGDDYSQEVIRVLAKMPKWIPAMQNGTKVATWFTQPVSFIGVE